MIELYHARTIEDFARPDGRTYHRIALDWFVVDRRCAAVSYGRSITGYATLSPEKRWTAEHIIDECLTRTEAHTFAIYLRDHLHMAVTLTSVELPLDGRQCAPAEVEGDDAPPVLDCYTTRLGASQDAYRVYDLTQTPGYSLPVLVHGVYGASWRLGTRVLVGQNPMTTWELLNL